MFSWLALLACKPPSPSEPIEAIELCGSGCVDGTDPHDKTEKTVGEAQTFAWGQADLMPPSNDPNGSTQRLLWTPSASHQVLAAFDTDYSGPLSVSDNRQPYFWKFVALEGSASGKQIRETFSYVTPDNVPAFATGQLIRYDRGACRNFAGESLILDVLSGLVDSGVFCAICAANQSYTTNETRDSQDIELSFTSHFDDIQHGVVLTASYEGDAQVQVNPAYVFGIDPETGRLSVTVAALDVVATDATVRTKVEAALSHQVVTGLAANADPGATNLLPFSLPIPCAQSGSVAAQQAFCSMQALVAQPGASRAFVTLHAGLVTDHLEPTATTLAHDAVAALTPRNFSCEDLGDGNGPQCVMRLVYKRVYMLPGQLEAVFADPEDTGLVALADAIGGQPLCPAPTGVGGSGRVPRLQVGSGDISGVCGSCP
jgi:hypothetical protein